MVQGKTMNIQIAIIGNADATEEERLAAYTIGTLLGKGGIILLNGGKGGVMEAAAKGAKDHGGTTVSILPGINDTNRYTDIRISTDMGQARNVILVLSADAVIAVGGSFGTLSEIAIARKVHIPIFGWKTWDIDGLVPCLTPEDTVSAALKAASGSKR